MTFCHKKVLSRFIGVSSLTKDCRLSVFWSPDWVLYWRRYFFWSPGEVFIGCSSAFTQTLSTSAGRSKSETFSKRRTNIDLSTVGSNKKVFTGCSSLDTKFPTWSQTSATIFRCFFLHRAKCLWKIYISCVPGVNQMVPLSIIAIIASLKWFKWVPLHFSPPLHFLCFIFKMATNCMLPARFELFMSPN